MSQTVRAVIDEHGIRLLEPVQISGRHQALVTILDETSSAEMHEASDELPDEQELARRRELGRRIDELRARTVRPGQPLSDSVEIIRQMRDHPRHEQTGD